MHKWIAVGPRLNSKSPGNETGSLISVYLHVIFKKCVMHTDFDKTRQGEKGSRGGHGANRRITLRSIFKNRIHNLGQGWPTHGPRSPVSISQFNKHNTSTVNSIPTPLFSKYVHTSAVQGVSPYELCGPLGGLKFANPDLRAMYWFGFSGFRIWTRRTAHTALRLHRRLYSWLVIRYAIRNNC
jgi:hypothetical protein